MKRRADSVGPDRWRRGAAGRRALRAVTAGVLLAASAAAPASAQSTPPAPAVGVRLVSQSVWNGPKRPLSLSVAATNQGSAPLKSLALALTIEAPARSRSVYRLSLRTDATAALLGFAFVEPGELAPGVERTFSIRQDVANLSAFGDSAIYPLRIQLLSNEVPVATLRTPMIYLTERPRVPLGFAWTWVLDEPVQYGPNGVFRPGPIEGDVAPGGRLAATVAALVSAQTAADVAVGPVVVDELRRMSAGYRIQDASGQVHTVAASTGGAAQAADVLAALTTLARRSEVELDAVPFGATPVPASLDPRLPAGPRALLDRGAAMVRSVLGPAPSVQVVRPPNSELDAAGAAALSGLGFRIGLVDPGFLSQPSLALGLTPPPVARVGTAGAPFSVVLPDPAVAADVAANPADPVAAAHAALGELASIWFEFPGTPGRGAAMLFGEQPAISPAFLKAFAPLVREAPWLAPVTATELVSSVTGATRQPIPRGTEPRFAPRFVGELARAVGQLAQFEQTAPSASSLIGRMRDDLLTAESGTFIADPAAGSAFVRAVPHALRMTYREVRLADPVAFTLTSRRGVLPVTVRNRTGFRLRVALRVVSDRRLAFPSGSKRFVTLGATTQSFTFAVRADTTGRIPIKIQVLTPATATVPDEITQIQTVVRSTAYNRVALALTIGAAIFLLGWWGRRFLPGHRV